MHYFRKRRYFASFNFCHTRFKIKFPVSGDMDLFTVYTRTWLAVGRDIDGESKYNGWGSQSGSHVSAFQRQDRQPCTTQRYNSLADRTGAPLCSA